LDLLVSLHRPYPSGVEDVASGQARRSREQTNNRIAELFVRGDTQGDAPGPKWGGSERDRGVRGLDTPNP